VFACLCFRLFAFGGSVGCVRGVGGGDGVLRARIFVKAVCYVLCAVHALHNKARAPLSPQPLAHTLARRQPKPKNTPKTPTQPTPKLYQPTKNQKKQKQKPNHK
jgi:outer membrane biosynthesis protein TonB